MAQRRMFSLKIIDSARFLKMPMSSQLLYFHLCMRADDDGIVEGYNVLRMTGVNEDDLRVLSAKGFVKVLNEDLVAYIEDWREHNKLRADRKVDSIYKDLLLKVIPDVELLEPKKRADLKQSKACTVVDGQWTDNGQTMDCLGEDRLDKDSIGKERIDKNNNSSVVVHGNIDIFKHFEKCGFIVTGQLMEFISADIEIFSAQWLMDAANESVKRGKINNYKYVLGILQNWQTEGREENNGATSKSNENTGTEGPQYNFSCYE